MKKYENQHAPGAAPERRKRETRAAGKVKQWSWYSSASARRWVRKPGCTPRWILLHSNAVTVLLGATQAGKTSLMRIMAGLDAPERRTGAGGRRMSPACPVRHRNVAMVYQQFINYPSLSVADNIASPLKLRGEKTCRRVLHELAERLHIEMFLDRLPAELSGAAATRGVGPGWPREHRSCCWMSPW